MVIYRHSCRLCRTEVYEEPFEIKGRIYVDDICNKCIEKRKKEYRPTNEKMVVELRELQGEERERYFRMKGV